MAVAIAPPPRTFKQRESALARANEIRIYRAQLKRDLKAGKANTRDLITDPGPMLDTMHVFDLLLATPKVGRVKANKWLNRCRISPAKTLGGLSDRQRKELTHCLWRAA